MRRLTAKQLALAAMVLVLVLGVGGAVSAETVITHFVRGNINNLRHYEMALLEFQKIHPDIDVEFQLVDPNGYTEKLVVRIASNSAPDVAWSAGGDFHQLALAGYLVDLGPYIERDGIDMSMYYPGAVEDGKFNGIQYAMPYQTHPGIHGLLYNRDLFAFAGLMEPDDQWTWDDLLAAARSITRDTTGDGVNDIWGYSVILGNVESDTMIYSLGGAYTNDAGTESLLATPETINAYRFFADMVHEYNVAPTPSEAPWWGELFPAGRLGMTLIGPWHLSGFIGGTMPFDVGVANIPIGPGGRVAGGPSTDLYVILAQGKDAEAAWEWVKFLTSEEGLRIQTEFLSNPTPLNSVNGFLLEKYGAYYDPFIDGLINGTYRGFATHNYKGTRARQIVFDGVQPIWTGQEPPETALLNAHRLLSALLEEPMEAGW